MPLAMILMLLPPFITVGGLRSIVPLPRPVVRFATGVDGSIPVTAMSFEPPQGQGWPPLGPTTGIVRLAVIAAQFSDIPHTETIEQVRQDYFGVNNSLAAYYSEVSYGKLTVTGDVFGWYNLPYPEVHYGKNCLNINDANCDGQDVSWEIAQDVIKQAERDVNFSNYDYFAFVHSGNGQESSHVPVDVWSVTYVSGVSVETSSRPLVAFSVVAELEAKGRMPLGVYCAEFGHLLGVPDMFNTATGRTQMGPWELEEMGTWNGQPSGSSPAEMSSWDRLKIGWLSASDEEVFEQSTAALDSLNPLEEPIGMRAAQIDTADSYYLLEVRAPIGFDSALPAFGVIVYQITNSDAVGPFRKVAGLTTAFDAGYRYASNGSTGPNVSFKIFNSFANGSFLIGFGASSLTQAITLTINVEPATPNVTVLVNGQSYLTNENGTLDAIDLEDTNSYNVTVPSIAPVGVGERAVFDQWANGTNATSITLPDNQSQLTAIYQLQYYVNLNTSHGIANGAGWYDQGANATISVPEIVNDTQPGTRYMFTTWEGANNETSNAITFQVQTPSNLTAVWATQFYLNIDTGGHAVTSGDGWYDAGSTATYSLLPPGPENGSWYIFQGWIGDSTNSAPYGSVNITGPMTLTAKWTSLNWMTISFVDASGQAILPSRGLVATIVAPNGTTMDVSQSPNLGIWLENGTYSVSSVTTLGTNVCAEGQSFVAQPNGVVIIPLALYNLTIKIQDAITWLPISGANVTITLPDGTTQSNRTGVDGTVMFDQLPIASYAIVANGPWLLQSTGSATLATGGPLKFAIGVIYFPSVAVVAVSALTAAIVTVRMTRRRNRSHDRTNRRKREGHTHENRAYGLAHDDSDATDVDNELDSKLSL